MLETFVNRPDWSASEQDIVESLRQLEQSLLDAAGEDDSLQYEDPQHVQYEDPQHVQYEDPQHVQYEDPQHVEVLRDVLVAALKDDHITVGELNLLNTLRDSLGLSEAVLRIVLAQLEHFPQPGNVLHTPSDCRDVLNKLQRGGIVFHCNKADGSPYVIPDEIRAFVMNALGVELGLHAWELLLESLTVVQLKLVLTKKNLPTSGPKPELKGRVISSGMRPSRVLGILSNPLEANPKHPSKTVGNPQNSENQAKPAIQPLNRRFATINGKVL